MTIECDVAAKIFFYLEINVLPLYITKTMNVFEHKKFRVIWSKLFSILDRFCVLVASTNLNIYN